MPITINGTGIVYPSGTQASAPTQPIIGGNYLNGYPVGSFVMSTALNPKTPQSLLNQTILVNGTAGYLIPWPTWYYSYGMPSRGNNYSSPYTAAGNQIITGFITSVSSVVNFPATNTNYYALPGTWRSSGWVGDGSNFDEQYMYLLWRRVA
jgi:hypothetical protein